MRTALPLARPIAALIRGTGAEFVRGDLIEDYRARLEGDASRTAAEIAYLEDVLVSLLRWWMPGALRLRARNERDGSYDPMRTWRGKGGSGMGDWVTNVRQGMRGLRRRPGFTVLTVATLALGIGVTTAIVTVVDSVMLRPLAYQDPDQIVAVGVTFPGREWSEDVPQLQHLAGVSLPNFRDLRERARSFDGLGGFYKLSTLLSDEGRGPEIIGMGGVTEDYFAILGAPLELGRLFLPDEYAGGSRVVLLSHASWTSRYGSDPDILGKSIPEGSTQARTVVGVLGGGYKPPEPLSGVAHGSGEIELWIPLELEHSRYELRGTRSLTLVGRLSDGSSVESARTEVEEIGRELAREFPEGNVYPNGKDHFGYGVNSLHDETVGTAGRALTIFLGAASPLLAIAALNAANLLLVRGLVR